MDATDWDEFADTYAAIQQESSLPIEQDVARALSERFALETLTIADIAAGSGRYARPLARLARHVALYDWAPRMLTLAARWVKHDHTSYLVTDWRNLPLIPLADLVFVSQLPTLTQVDVSHLRRLARVALIVNVQSAQTDSLTAACAKILNLPAPVSAQVDPARLAMLEAVLPNAERLTLSYQRHEPVTVSEALTAFAQPFGAQKAQAVASALGAKNAHALMPSTQTYTFTLFIDHL